MRRNWVGSAMAAALLLASGAVQAKTLKVGEPAPDFEVVLMDGSKIHLADMRGKVVVLNFWATWCVPCRRELPLIDSYYIARKDNGLRVFAVATEDSVPAYRLKPLFAAMAIPAARKIKGPYGVLGALPTNFVIDRRGIVRYAKASAFELDDLNAVLVPLLREPAPATP